jgi:hypothetical protein
MTLTVSRIVVATMLALAIAGCNRNSADNTQSQTEATGSIQPAAPPPPAETANTPAPIPPSTEVQVDKVTSVMLSRPPKAPDSIIIRAAGAVVSAGWTEAKLVPVEDPNAAPNIRIFSFVATSPAMPDDARAIETVEVELTVDMVPAEVKTIRVVSATNMISAPIVQ